MTAEEFSQSLNAEMQKYRTKIVNKDTWFWKLLDILVKVFTLGKNDRFLTSYVTTIGRWIAVPKDWYGRSSATQCFVLAHELVHVRQFAKAGLGSPVLGILPMFLVYVFFPLPMFFAWGRYALERTAYLEGLLAHVKFGINLNWNHIESIVTRLSGPDYAWTWIRSNDIRHWILSALAKSGVDVTPH